MNWCPWLLWGAVACAAMPALARACATRHPLQAALSAGHIAVRPLVVVLSTTLAGLAVTARYHVQAVALVLVALWETVELKRRHRGETRGHLVDGAALTIMSANLHHANPGDGVSRSVRAVDPDLLVTLETNAASEAAIKTTSLYQKAAGSGPRGSMVRIWARDNVSVVEAGQLAVPGDLLPVVVLERGEQAIRVVGVHLQAPITPSALRLWRSQLTALAEFCHTEAAAGRHTVLVGDFNASSGHREFRYLRSSLDPVTNRHVATPGERTWPVRRALPAVLDIDHVLTTESVRITESHVTPVTGSDHLAVVVGLLLPAISR